MNQLNWQTAEGQRETMCRRDFTDLTNFWVAVRVTRQLQRAGSIWTSCVKTQCKIGGFSRFCLQIEKHFFAIRPDLAAAFDAASILNPYRPSG